MLDLKGWRRTSLIDYPSHIATVVFTGGCNFRCPMCHNGDLVLNARTLPTLDEVEIWRFLEKRAGQVTGLVVTGGEPTLQSSLADFLRRVRARGVHTKLDTNGYRPEVLADLLEHDLLDYVAMDVKASPKKYTQLTGCPDLDLRRIERSIAVLQECDVTYEFRTTVVPGLLDGDDIEAIAQWLAGANKYVLQQFRGGHTLGPDLAHVSPYSQTVLHTMMTRAQTWVENTTLRGL